MKKKNQKESKKNQNPKKRSKFSETEKILKHLKNILNFFLEQKKFAILLGLQIQKYKSFTKALQSVPFQNPGGG